MSSPVDAVVCDGLVKIYQTDTSRVQAVRGVDLRIPAGRSVAVAGPSGSGKSSLLRMISGLSVPSAGRVTVGGVDLAAVGRFHRRRIRTRLISHIEQRPSDNLLPHLSAIDQLQVVASRCGSPPGVATGLLSDLGLDARRNYFPHELSGGEKQRLAFALGAVGGAALIVADEPTAELDRNSAGDVLTTIEMLVETGTSVLVATHDQSVVDRLEMLVELDDGAVASVTADDGRLAAIDSSGRLQLPPEVREVFPDGFARLQWDPEAGRLIVEQP